MKEITKQQPPARLIAWKAEEVQENLCYANMPKAEVKESLLQEQGYICAYTMRRICDKSSHIEHLFPQSRCVGEHEGRDIDYQNMVACFPVDGGDMSHRFGAPIKKGEWSPDFITPLENACERSIKYTPSGKVKWLDSKGEYTVNLLKLDDASLEDNRKAAIKGALGFGNRSRGRQLSKSQLQALTASVCQPSDGKFVPYCIAIKQAAEKVLASR